MTFLSLYAQVHILQCMAKIYSSCKCNWFVVNKLGIHFGNDETKSILFPSKFKTEKGQKAECKKRGCTNSTAFQN